MKMEEKNTKALELIANELHGRGLDKQQIVDRIHQATFLATIEASSNTLGSRVADTPLFRIAYDQDSNSLEFTFLKGEGMVPDPEAVDIDYADLVYASLICDRLTLLTQGTTGTGKTYTLDQILKTIYAADNQKILRLNANMSNVLQPYIEGKVDPDEGVLRININRDAVRKIAALGIDEQNRGDTNAVLGLLDNQVILATGERADLGLLIPQLEFNGSGVSIHYDEDMVKPVAINSAQNPPDAEYTGVRRTDSAVGNRQIRIDFPNMALNSGAATINMGGRFNNHHGTYMDNFTGRLAGYLGIDNESLRELMLPQNSEAEEKVRANDEYLSVHAMAFDPGNAKNMFLKSAVEIQDHLVMLTSGNGLDDNFKKELAIAQDWTQALSKYEVNFTYNATIDPSSNTLARIDNVRAAMDFEVEERDKTKSTNVADALALITRYKKAFAVSEEEGASTLDEFAKLHGPLTARDISSAYEIILNDKIKAGNGVSPVGLINQAFTDYVSLHDAVSSAVYKEGKKFGLNDPDAGIRYLATYLAVNDIKDVDGLSGDQYASRMIEQLNRGAALIRGLDEGSDTMKLLVSRVNADVSSLAGFIDIKRKTIGERFNQIGSSDRVMPRYDALMDIVRETRGEVTTNYTMPRVERIFGL